MGKEVDVSILAIFLGIIVGLYGGLWVMRYMWDKTNKEYWDLDVNKRSEIMEKRKSDAIETIFVTKFMIKGGLIATIFFVIYLLNYL